MAIWPFNRRNRVDDDVPVEIRDYYNAERRERRGIAWLLGIGTLLVTVALAVLLFFGGRWLFRSIFDKKNTDNVAQNEPAQTPEPSSENSRGDEEVKPETTPSAEQSTPDQSTPETSPPPPPPPAETTPEPTTPPATPPAASSKTAKAKDANLPHTGPSETIGVFMAVTLLAAVSHNLYTRKQLSK